MSWSADDERWAEFAMLHEEFIDELKRSYKEDPDDGDFCKTVQTYPIRIADIEELYDKLTYIYASLAEYADLALREVVQQMQKALRPFVEYIKELEEDLEDFKEACFEVEKDFALEQELRERRFVKPVQYHYIPAVTRNMPYMRRRF